MIQLNLDTNGETFGLSKKSPTGPTEQTPKPEHLIALATYLGVRWDSVPFNFSWRLAISQFRLYEMDKTKIMMKHRMSRPGSDLIHGF